MKDYYDIHALTTAHGDEIAPEVFARALRRTARQRHIELGRSGLVISDIADCEDMRIRWKRYQENFKFAGGITFADAAAALGTLGKWSGLAEERS
jgi:hypothetical protein